MSWELLWTWHTLKSNLGMWWHEGWWPLGLIPPGPCTWCPGAMHVAHLALYLNGFAAAVCHDVQLILLLPVDFWLLFYISYVLMCMSFHLFVSLLPSYYDYPQYSSLLISLITTSIVFTFSALMIFLTPFYFTFSPPLLSFPACFPA